MKNRHFVIFGLLPLALFLIGAAAVSRDLVIQNAANAPGLTIIKPGSQTSNLIEAYIGSGSKLSLSRDGNMALNGYLSLSGETNRLTVADGSLLLDGAAVGGNSGDPFVITSELADNVTNVAMVVDTANLWVYDTIDGEGAHLFDVRNAGTNVFWVNGHGGLNIGRGSLEAWGDDQAIISFMDTSMGDIPFGDVTFGVTDGGSLYSYIYLNPNENAARIEIAPGSGTVKTLLFPDQLDGETPYKLDTSIAHTLGNLLEVKNNGTITLAGTYDGRLVLAGTTNQVVFGGTNTAPVSSAAPTKWISVQVSGESATYRLPLYE